jgi:hypothetical protein
MTRLDHLAIDVADPAAAGTDGLWDDLLTGSGNDGK